MKKIIFRTVSVILVIASLASMLCAYFPVGATTYVGKCGDDCSWNLDTRYGKLTISGKGSMASYTDNTEAPWYNYREYINEIEIEKGITQVGGHCFEKLPSLNLVVIGNSVKKLGDYCFLACQSLKKVTMSEYCKLKYIGRYAFAYCRNLYSIIIPEYVETIDEGAFFYCYSIEELTLGYSVTKIEKLAFSCCSNMKRLRIVNYDCDIFDGGSTFYEGITLEAFSRSTAKDYANKYLRNYEAISDLKFLEDLKISLSYSKTVYSGKKKTPKVAIKGLKQGTDYTVSYSNNTKVGTATVIISSAGDVYGEVTKQFKIVPDSPKKVKAVKTAKTSVTLSWSKVKKATNYIVYRYKDGKAVKIASLTGDSYTVKGLTKNKQYKFAVKAYTKIGNEKYYSQNSKVLKVTTKKK